MSEPNNNQNNQNNQNQGQQSQQTQTPDFDYDKLASLISGKQSVAEDTVLKAYFREQGLSSDEMKQAISAFKEKKAANTPDLSKLQSDLTAANSARMAAVIEQKATLEAISQGVDVTSVPYILKMADFNGVADEKGEIDSEKLTAAIKKVLDDVPALKGESKKNSNNGFNKIGGDGKNQNTTDDEVLRGIFGLK